MKILIIGRSSYIGDHIDEWLTQYGHVVTQLDVLTDEWKSFDYSDYYAIVHVAGIVHRPDCTDWELYKRVNADMPLEIAQKAKVQGVKQYVYFSTMGVYKMGKELRPSIVRIDTPLVGDDGSMYGKSKLMAEKALNELNDATFSIAIVRPPSVYGKGCKGGYIIGFTKIARMLPVFPRAYEDVKQSFVYIDNLSECVRIIIENHLCGVFCPQDDEIPNANRLFAVICNSLGKNIVPVSCWDFY